MIDRYMKAKLSEPLEKDMAAQKKSQKDWGEQIHCLLTMTLSQVRGKVEMISIKRTHLLSAFVIHHYG